MTSGLLSLFYYLTTLLLSLVLMSLPLTSTWQWINPEWPLLVLVYWAIRNPAKNYVFSGFLLGLYIDILWHDFLGVNAFLYAFFMFALNFFFTNIFRKRFFEQVKVIFYMLSFKLITLSLWLYYINQVPFQWPSIVHIFTSLLIWPWLVLLLNIFTYNNNDR